MLRKSFFLCPPPGQRAGAAGDRLPGLPVGSHPDQLHPHHRRHPRPVRHHPVPAEIRQRGEFHTFLSAFSNMLQQGGKKLTLINKSSVHLLITAVNIKHRAQTESYSLMLLFVIFKCED